MRLLGFLLLASMLMAALKMTIAALAIALMIAILIGIVTKPAETFGFIVLFVYLGWLERHPMPTLLTTAAAVILCLVQAHWPVQILRPATPSLADGQE